jgi:hypothetical protein
MTTRDEIFEKEQDITFTEIQEDFTKIKRQPKKLNIDFEKERNDFLASLIPHDNKPEVKKVKVEMNNERKLQLIENLKKAREQKKLNKQKDTEPIKQEPIKQEIKQEPVKQEPVKQQDYEYLEWKKQKQIKEDSEYLEWKKQKEKPKEDVKLQVKETVKIEPVKQEQKYITISTIKKPKWG